MSLDRNKNERFKPIGFFDSGVGGISVLREAVKLLPSEDFIYFGDSKNAPYGVKDTDDVKRLTFNAVHFLIEKGAKAVVIACNTATSAAIEELRLNFTHIPVIGIEPALKPAIELNRKGKIIIMATPMTLLEDKFNNLVKNFRAEKRVEPLPCPGLVELIEDGILEGEKMDTYLRNKFLPYVDEEIAAVVLGCTHYPFIRKSLEEILPKDTPIIDGSSGTVKQLRRQLEAADLLNDAKNSGKVQIYNSAGNENMLKLSYKLLRQE